MSSSTTSNTTRSDTTADAVPRRDEPSNPVADGTGEIVTTNPWIEAMTRWGWGAKGAVYLLMGLTAVTVARRRPTDDDASPEGAVAQVIQNPGGRILLALLAIGLVLYTTWRLLSAALIRGWTVRDWLDRAGFVLSGTFYAILTWTAVRASLRGVRPEDSNAVERLSASLLGSTSGRWTLGVLGVVVFGVGAFFVVDKALRRSFLDELDLDRAPVAERRAVVVLGVAGWLCRGVVTVLVGFFVTKAAVEADVHDARGFDRALRELATTSLGRFTVGACGVGLVIYGIFCAAIIRHEALDDHR